MILWAKYGTQTDIRFPMVKRGFVDLAATADWTPATGDTKVSKDGGNVANSANNPAAVGGTGSVSWKLTLSAAELQAAEVNIQIVDSATKAVEDQFLAVYTYGHASAKIQADLSDVIHLGLTALPNAAAEASGGLATLSAAQASNGTINANVHRWLTGTPNALQSGRVDSYIGAIVSGVIAAASFAASALDAVWSTAARTLTAGTNIALAKGTGVTGFNDPSSSDITTAVWAAGARTLTSFGTLVVDIWANATRTLTAIAESVFAADTAKYQAKLTLVDDDDGDTDRYVAVWFKNGQPVTSGITVPTIQVIKVADGADLVASTAMTQIASTGAYRYDEATNRIVDGVAYFGKITATIDGSTRTWESPVGRDS